MRFTTRVFVWSFLPTMLLLTGGYWVAQRLVMSTVRDGVRSLLGSNQLAIARMNAKSEQQNARFLSIIAESAALKAGLQLLRSEPHSSDARRTVEDQLQEICEALHLDFLVVSISESALQAGVIRTEGHVIAMNVAAMKPPARGFWSVGARVYYVTSVPVNQAGENIGVLAVGELFDMSQFSAPMVLRLEGKVLESTLPAPRDQVESALAACGARPECEMRLNGETYLSARLEGMHFGDGYALYSFQGMDAASGPVQAGLRSIFLIVTAAGSMIALVLGIVSSRWIAKPIDAVVSRLRESEETGVLPEFPANFAPALEIRQLTEGFNRAAAAIRESRDKLERAYVDFVGALAGALDARDQYTAGHSRRVSEYSCAIASALNTPPEDLETIRIGALLHDIGKIGVSDALLLKPTHLTAAERAAVRQHPTLGRAIVERVTAFRPYLPVIELHHENWDGTGYPWGLRGPDTPRAARIVQVADAYDAMTSDRPYRRAMAPEAAVRVLEDHAGTQFDPEVVPVFVKLLRSAQHSLAPGTGEYHDASLQALASAVDSRRGAEREPAPAGNNAEA